MAGYVAEVSAAADAGVSAVTTAGSANADVTTDTRIPLTLIIKRSRVKFTVARAPPILWTLVIAGQTKLR